MSYFLPEIAPDFLQRNHWPVQIYEKDGKPWLKLRLNEETSPRVRFHNAALRNQFLAQFEEAHPPTESHIGRPSYNDRETEYWLGLAATYGLPVEWS